MTSLDQTGKFNQMKEQQANIENRNIEEKLKSPQSVWHLQQMHKLSCTCDNGGKVEQP